VSSLLTCPLSGMLMSLFTSHRWLFLIEGIITCAFGCLGPLMIVGYPRQKYSWLSHDEQRYLILRQRYSTNGQVVPRNEGNSPGLVKEVASRWHIYFQASHRYTVAYIGFFSLVPNFLSFCKRIDGHLLQPQCVRILHHLYAGSYLPFSQVYKGKRPCHTGCALSATAPDTDPMIYRLFSYRNRSSRSYTLSQSTWVCPFWHVLYTSRD
jgi:hypothetical protein